MTTKLYYEDAYLQEFDAAVLETRKLAGNQWAIVLDRTTFYPEGGGQPSDHGWINGVPVIDVQEQDGSILHITGSSIMNGAVTAQIDWQRRFDHMQQHTGQHILSGVFSTTLGADTIGFHLGSEKMHVDLDLDNLTAGQADTVEQAANHAVFMNNKVNCFFADMQDFEKYKLRKSPTKDFDRIRLVDIEKFDCCPCGGTHVMHTGEIGVIKILGTERRNKALRVEFVCGERALTQYAQEHNLLTELSSTLSSPILNLSQAISQQQEKFEARKAHIHNLEEERSSYLAKLLLQDAQTVNNTQIITYMAENYTPAEITALGKRCLAEQRVVVLLAAVNKVLGKVHLYFACSSELDIKMGQHLKAILPLVDGRGYAAQGGGTNLEHVEEALCQAKSAVVKLIDSEI